MKRISFAQNREDILLDRVFNGRTDGFYIDVGACHPVFHSVTKFFYDRGWRGINIEPIPSAFEVLARDRPEDVNLQVGLSNREETLRFHEVPAAVGYSTFSSEQAELLRSWGYELIEHTVPVTTLARVCEQYAPGSIDFLKIDVESYEREVLEGSDWIRYRPRVVLIEATRPGTTIPCHEDWEPLLLSNDYLFAAFDGLNRYYVRAEDRELLPILGVPVNIFDDFETFEHFLKVQEMEHTTESLGRQVEELQRTEDELLRALEGTSTRLEELPKLRNELDRVRSELEVARRDLGASQSDLRSSRIAYDRAGGEIAAMKGRIASLEAELRTARERLALFEGWGPMTVSVARRLRSVAVRVPLAKSMLRRALGVARGLRAAAINPHA